MKLPGTEVFDAIVVGSGASGSSAAVTLANNGLSVLVLEAGADLSALGAYSLAEPGQPQDEASTLSAFGDLRHRLRSSVGGQRIQAKASAFTPSTKHLFVNDLDNPYSTPMHRPYRWIRGRQVGGRLHTWGRVSLRFSNREFHAASHDGYGDDWPISLEDLEADYDRGEALLRCNTVRGKDVALSSSEETLRALILREWPEKRLFGAPMAAPSDELVPRLVGDMTNASGLELRSLSIAERVTIDPATGKANGVDYINSVSGERSHVRGRSIMLCASAFETVRLLLNSCSSRFPHGIGNSHDQLGRYVMEHSFFIARGNLPHQSARDSDLDKPSDGLFYIAPTTGSAATRNESVSGLSRNFGISGSAGREGDWWWMGAFGEMLASPDNRLSLHRRRRDAWGIPIAHINMKRSPQDQALARAARQTIGAMAEAAGWTELSARHFGSGAEIIGNALFHKHGFLSPGLSIHELGGARMGISPVNSVVDALGRCWDCQNVVVADGACFTSGGFQNPALTIVALAIRAARELSSDIESLGA